MPIVIPNNLPAAEVLRDENIFVMDTNRAVQQDIRPIRIVLLNLMPTKIATETHILRLLSNTPLQTQVQLLHMDTHESKNTPKEHLEYFYKTFEDIRHEKFDGLIITGAPVEQIPFEEVDYWNELKEVMDWSVTNVTSTFYICWGAQAGLYYHHGIPKYPLEAKMFGNFYHQVYNRKAPIVRGFDDGFLAPHSRHTEVKSADIIKVPELEIISESPEAGVYIVVSCDQRQVFVTGHSEYDPSTLKDEYERDVKKGLKIAVPKNYFPNNDPSLAPVVKWRSHANLLFSNWLNYHVYQNTPYDINDIGNRRNE